MTFLLTLGPWLIVAAGCWLGALLLRQNGRILIRLEALERELVISRIQRHSAPGGEQTSPVELRDVRESSLSKSRINRNGLQAGAPAPGFTLPRVDGSGTVSLSDYAGRPFLLVLASADCGPCESLLSRLTELPPEIVKDSLLVVSRGTEESSTEKSSKGKVLRHQPAFPIVLQRSWEVSRLYGTFKLPSAYVITADGLIASEMATGPDAIWAIAQVLFGLLQRPHPAEMSRAG